MAKGVKTRNLALLGTGLAAAAMLAGRGKGKEKETKGPETYADMPSGEKVLSESGEDSGFRRNPESGDLYRDVLSDRRTRAQEAADDEKIMRATGVRPRAALKSGGKVGSASKRADGCAIKGKTRGRMV